MTGDQQPFDSNLAAENERLKRALQTADIGTWEFDPINQIVHLDDRCQQLLGVSVPAVVPYPEVLQHVHPDDRVTLQAAISQALRPECEPPFSIRYRLAEPVNGACWLHSKGKAYFDQQNQPYRLSGITQDVTHEIQTQQQLRDSVERFRSLIEQAPVATALFVGKDLVIELANEPILTLWGKGNSALGKPLAEALPELREQPFLQILNDVYTSGIPYQAVADKCDLLVDGKLRTFYFNFTYKPLFDKQGLVYAIMNMAVDVTDQVLARQKVEASEARLRSVITSAPAAMGLFVGRDLIVDMPNQAFIEIVGKGPDIVGKPLRDVMPELDSQPFLQILDDVFTSGKTYKSFGTQVNIVQHGVMTHNFYNITYSPLFDANGKVYAILDIAIDVTERVIVQQQIEESRLQLLNSFEQSPVAIAIIREPDLTFHMANPFYGDLVGRTPAELVGKPLLEALPELAGQGFDQLLREVIATGVPFTAKEVPVDIVRHDQLATIFVDLTYQPQYESTQEVDGDKSVSGILVVATDVTGQVHSRRAIEESEVRYRALSLELEQQVELRTQELAASNEELAAINEELMAANEELAESNQLFTRSNENLQQFAYIASHDLQEPLRKVQSFGDLLKSKYGDQLGDGIDYLERMQSSANRMSLFIKDLLSFSRISTRRDATELVSLTGIVAIVLADLELVINETNAIIDIDTLPVIKGDKSQLGQLFQNLLSNALKFHRDGVQPRIQVTAREMTASDLPPTVKPARAAKQYQCITISDNGIGFDEKYLDRIFQIFQRLHSKSNYSGTGIGLAICEKVVTNHGGAITASSQPGQGASFSVYLPV
ncbi:PAS domain-containing sensor histidine kinase [Spirosoma agri]|uniref:histidine kinase n=1 Tax=Spirosoma agri TaxID=1987381 RepID=A0A6M0IHU0_9BACT|nr:PAS domain-containing protein [Spirosoma agri]NEU67826.1 PAS domain-containing protein [Spirosoma agri]